jgi:microcystin-dependent protein
MSDIPYLGEIRIFAGTFAPLGWMFCEGQTLPISENDALFTLIGTTYGGDGQETFNLPDLRGRLPLHWGTGSDGSTYQIAEQGGVESVTLTVNQTPAHTHPMVGSAANATTTSPTGNVAGTASEVTVFPYGTDNPPTTLSPQSLAPAGGSQPHDNFQPYICINYIISMFGVFPSQT